MRHARLVVNNNETKRASLKTVDGIEGKILLEDLEGDRFYYDDATASFKGKKSNIKIRKS